MAVSQSRQPVTPEPTPSSFAQVLIADGPDASRAKQLALYGWLVGHWELEVTTFLEDGRTHRGAGEIHAAWVLQGRAIQDVWMIPRLRDRTPGIEQLPGAGRSLAEFLAGRVAELDGDRKLPIHVVGHGVGGTLATVVALWLLDTQGSLSARDLAWDPQHRAKLHCMAFANPTAGNSDFATYISDRLGVRLDLIHNSLDHAPALYDTQTLSGLGELYRPHVEEPVVVRALIEALSDELERSGVEYEQPPARVLEGRLNTRLPKSYVAQAEYQHLHAYTELLGLEGLDVDAILDRPAGTDDGPVAQ